MYNSTIQENFTLPSKGLIYDQKFDPTITLRSMTVMEEMKRLSYNASEYKVMSEIIDDCIYVINKDDSTKEFAEKLIKNNYKIEQYKTYTIYYEL